MTTRTYALAAALLLAGTPIASSAGEADVLNATAQKQSDGTYRISATIPHGDTSWEHYASFFMCACLTALFLEPVCRNIRIKRSNRLMRSLSGF